MMESKSAQDGVNLKEGDSFSEFAGALCRKTWGNSSYLEVRDFSMGHFRGPRAFRLKNLPNDCWMDISPDGDGTKPVLVDAAGDYENAARGFVAMTCGDITRWGGIPLLIVNNLNVGMIGKLGEPANQALRTMMLGLQRAANEQGVVMYKGETAEEGPCVGSENKAALVRYLWEGVAFGAYSPRTIITGDKIKEGMVVVALREKGFRNNGIISVRKALAMKFGPDYCSNPEAQNAVRQAATPAVFYDNFLAAINGWYAEDFQPIVPMRLVTHLTGGGIKSKFAEDILFPRGFSADLDDLWEPPDIMKQCAEWRGMSDEECYEVWNGGQGVLGVIDGLCLDNFFQWAKFYHIEAKIAGKITKKPSPVVTIKSKFRGDIVKFRPK